MRSHFARLRVLRLIVTVLLAVQPGFAASAMTWSLGAGEGGSEMICHHQGMAKPADPKGPAKHQSKCPCCAAWCLTGIAKLPPPSGVAPVLKPAESVSGIRTFSVVEAPARCHLAAATSPRGPPVSSL